jgi:hypothetical protein
MQWEYIAPYLFGDLDDVLVQLKALGAEGWELVQLNSECFDGGSRVFLKRILQPKQFVLMQDGHDIRPGAINRVG